jgi:hypothetical protein
MVLSIVLAGCPYESPVEPAGPTLPLRSSLVGSWRCSSDEDKDWADLRIGWHEGSLYHLVLRSTKPPEPEANDDEPWVLLGRPRLIRGREIWSIWFPDDTVPKFSFGRLQSERGGLFTISMLGKGGVSSGDVPDGSTPVDIANLLNSRETVADTTIVCQR